jgi:hypothetical protein
MAEENKIVRLYAQANTIGKKLALKVLYKTPPVENVCSTTQASNIFQPSTRNEAEEKQKEKSPSSRASCLCLSDLDSAMNNSCNLTESKLRESSVRRVTYSIAEIQG